MPPFHILVVPNQHAELIGRDDLGSADDILFHKFCKQCTLSTVRWADQHYDACMRKLDLSLSILRMAFDLSLHSICSVVRTRVITRTCLPFVSHTCSSFPRVNIASCVGCP
ncbi:hypothetical protein D3C74_418060 [compost metagenome]